MRVGFVVLLALGGCPETTISTFKQPPVAVIQLPGDGAVFPERQAIEFVGKVADDGGPEDLLCSWIADGTTVLAGDVVPDAEGFVRLTVADLAVGTHAIALRAVDEDNLSHEVGIGVTIEDVIDNPSVQIVHPTTQESGEVDVQFLFEVTASDPQDPPEALYVDLASDLDGDVCFMPIDSNGTGLCRAALRTEGNHRLTFTVTDSDGNTATRTTIFPVDPVPEAPILTVVTPTPGQGILENRIFELRATVADRQDQAPAIAVEVTSDVEGFLCAMAVDAQGNAVCYEDLTVRGNQFLTFKATDPDLNVTEVDVLVRVTDSSGVDDDLDGFAEIQGDCDDANALVYPGAPELPDGLDNDCDGYRDEGTALADDDGDGYCESLVQPCTDGAALGDCNDAAAAINPAAPEICDGLDNNCASGADEVGAQGCTSFAIDADRDSFGDANTPTQCRCGPSAPWTALNTTDCNDTRNDVYPGAVERPDGVDNDCDNTADEGTDLYDDDGDGFCESTVQACTWGPAGGGDCDDGRPSVNPNGTEICHDALDSDCDGTNDDIGAQGCTLYYADADGDGYGAGNGACLCNAPIQAAPYGGDCDDANRNINPGALEIANGIDDNCDGRRDEGTQRFDDDGDGYCENNCTLQPGQVSPWPGGDCNDQNAAVNPGAAEVCGNGVDDNCSGQQNEGQNAVGCTNYWNDGDNDGYGAGSPRCYCGPTGNYDMSNGSDCYDNNSSARPGQMNFFNGHRGDNSYDYDCNGSQEKRFPDSAICRFSNPLFQLVCGSTEDGWLDDDPPCGQTDTWVTSCDYTGGGNPVWDIVACIDGSNKIVRSSTSRVQTCR